MKDNNWIKAQRVGLISALIRSWPNQNFRDIQTENNLNILLLEELKDIKMNTFPPWVLFELSRLKDYPIINELEKLLKEKNIDANKSYIIDKNMTDTNDNSIIKRAQIWSIALLKGDIESKRLLDYGHQLFSDSIWYDIRKNQEKLNEFTDSIEKLRMINIDVFNESNSRFNSISKILSLLNEELYAHQIANILYHNQFCWPLLVLGDPELSISLPIAVEINYDGENMIRTKPPKSEIETGIDFSQWIKNNNLKKAKEVGYMLWRSKHGHYGGRKGRYSYRKMAEDMSLTFDFRIAQLMGNKIFEKIDRDCFSIEGNSADSCLAQAVLDKLLGGFSLGYAAITGEVKEFNNNYDFKFSEILSPEKKLQHVNETNFYFNAVVPSDNYKEISIKSLDNINIFFSERQSKVADVVQSKTWRRHQYIRSPELKWYVHNYLLKNKRKILSDNGLKSLDNIKEKNIKSIIEEIETNENPVLSFEGISPRQLMLALWYINNKIRIDKFDKSKSDYNRSYTLTPPKFSWAVIRALEDEQDDQFWKIFWEAIGGSKTADFQDFILSHNKEYAIEKIEKALKTFNPSQNNPDFRSPDIFIIIGHEQFEISCEECKKNTQVFARPFMVSPILKELSISDNLNYRGPYEELNDLIGKTRIILLNDKKQSNLIEGDSGYLNLCSEKEKELLKTLCIYRWGFNYTMAKFLIHYANNNLSDINIHETFEALKRKNVIREVNMWYFIPEQTRKKLLSKLNTDSFLKYHYYAASSFAPYLFKDSIKTLSISLEKAFNTKYIHEARYHLNQVMDKSQKINSHYYFHLAREANNKLIKYTDITSKSVIDKLLDKNLNDSAYLLASYILNSDKLKKPHPLIQLPIAKAYNSKLTLSNEKNKDNLKENTKQIYIEALRKAEENVVNERTEGYTKFKIISEYILFIENNYFNNKVEVENLIKEAETLFYKIKFDKDLGLKGIDYEIFEKIAANNKNHKEVSLLYLKFLNYDAIWIQAFVKGLGAAKYEKLSGIVNKFKLMIDNLLDNNNIIDYLLKPDMIRNIILDLNYEKEYVEKRWYLGLKELYESNYITDINSNLDFFENQIQAILAEIFFYIQLEIYINKFPDKARENIKKAMIISNLYLSDQISNIDIRRIKAILNKKEPISKIIYKGSEKEEFSIKSNPALFFLTGIMYSEEIYNDEDFKLLIKKCNKSLQFLNINLNPTLKYFHGDIKLNKSKFYKNLYILLANNMPEAVEIIINFINKPNESSFIRNKVNIDLKIGIEILRFEWKKSLKLLEDALEIIDIKKNKFMWLEYKILEILCNAMIEKTTNINELEKILDKSKFELNKSFYLIYIFEGLKMKKNKNKNLILMLNFLEKY